MAFERRDVQYSTEEKIINKINRKERGRKTNASVSGVNVQDIERRAEQQVYVKTLSAR